MTLKTFYISFLLNTIECRDTIRVVQFLYHESMTRVLCFKPLSFCVNKPSLYPRNLVGILIKLIFLGSGIFLNDHNNHCCIFFFDGLLMLSLDLINGSLIVFLYFVCKLLSNLCKHHITTMLSEVFCLWLLA